MEESKSQQNHQKEIYNKNVLSFQQFSLSHIIGIIFVDFGRKFDKGVAYGQLFGWCLQNKNTVSGPIRLGLEVAKSIFLKDVAKIRQLFRLE